MTESRAFVNYGEGFATAVVTFSGLCAILKAGCITVGNVIGVGVTERINGNVLAGNLNTANGTVDYVIIATGSYTVGIYLVFNNNVTVAVACCRTGSASGVRSATTVVTNSGFATVGCTVCIVVEYIICEGVTESRDGERLEDLKLCIKINCTSLAGIVTKNTVNLAKRLNDFYPFTVIVTESLNLCVNVLVTACAGVSSISAVKTVGKGNYVLVEMLCGGISCAE